MEMRFRAGLDYDSLLEIYSQRLLDLRMQIPSALDQWFIENARNSEEKKLALLSREFREKSLDRFQHEVTEIEGVIQALESKQALKPTKTNQKSLDAKLRNRDRLIGKIADLKSGKCSTRIYPMSFAPLIVECGSQRKIIIARYQVAKEFESFNARRDSIQKKLTWKPLLGKFHGIFAFTQFYEWVEREGKKVMISFRPEGFELMWAPCLYKEYKNERISAFAMITDDPPPEVLRAGHDRCPIFLAESSLSKWLSPIGLSLMEIDSLFDMKEETTFKSQTA